MTRKSGGDKNIKDKDDSITYSNALMSIEGNEKKSESSKHGCLPVAEIKTDDNQFSLLKADGDEAHNNCILTIHE